MTGVAAEPRTRAGFRPDEKRSLLGMGATVVLLHLVGWGALFLLILPGLARAGGDTVLLVGLALSAYALGVRHAFDADHIVAIDNATRRLLARGKRPLSVGFWFALGHSSVVAVSVVLLVLGIGSFADSLADEGSGLRQVTGVWGATISGVFLILMGVLNLSSLSGLGKVLRSIRSGQFRESELDRHLDNRGLINRMLGPLARVVDTPRKMFPVGVLFGLGLDTAASIGLFVAAGVLAPGLPWYAVFVLPILFTAGMTLFDSADGVLMNRVYRWASVDPYRKVYYNLVVTGISVFVAFFVGGIGLVSVLADLGVDGGAFAMFSSIDLNVLGVALVGIFVFLFAGAALRWRPATLHPYLKGPT